MITNTYAGGTLDRAAHLRRDTSWLEQAWRSNTASVVPLWRGECLIDAGQTTRLPASWGEALLTRSPDLPWAFLGLTPAQTPMFAVDLSQLDQPGDLLPQGKGTFGELRAATSLLPRDQAALLAYAKALLEWRRRTRFCGSCGQPCRSEQAGHVMVCTACATQIFPRTDPTVIMLVTDNDRALLGHAARFPDSTMYSTLAGFVEPGESLEEAVAREVMEEAGIAVGVVRYHSSQPWPFPMNLMLGFHAEARSTAITIDRTELLDAAWFTRDQLRDPAAHGFTMPPPLSIARQLIDWWVEQTESVS